MKIGKNEIGLSHKALSKMAPFLYKNSFYSIKFYLFKKEENC